MGKEALRVKIKKGINRKYHTKYEKPAQGQAQNQHLSLLNLSEFKIRLFLSASFPYLQQKDNAAFSSLG